MKVITSEDIKKKYVKRFWKETRRMLVKVRSQVVEQSEHTDADRLKPMVRELLNSKFVKDQLMAIWSEVGGKFAFDTERTLKFQKAGFDSYELKEDRRKYWNERSVEILSRKLLKKIDSILDSETDAINRVIDEVVERISTEGLGIPQGRKLLKESLSGEAMTTMENWQAQRIAMTEVGGAANTGSYEGAKDVPGVKKEWLFIPGLKTFRANHQDYGNMEPQDMSYEYLPGLKFPGDANAEADEVINCYCSIGYSVD